MITFTKWESVDLLRSVPLDRLLVETDSPYLAPVPHRGKRNEPAFVRQVAERAALLRGESTESLIAATTANAFAFYGIEPSPSA
jgi:TatD DNase family protein